NGFDRIGFGGGRGTRTKRRKHGRNEQLRHITPLQDRSTCPADAPVSPPFSQVGSPLTSVISMPRERTTMRFAPPGRSWSRSARVFHDCTVNSFSRSSSSVTSSSASTPSTPRSAAISATVLPSYLFSPADLTSCTVIRAQSAKEAGRFRSCLNWFLKFTSLYTADCAALDVSSNSRFHDGHSPNANGLRLVSSRVSGSGEV